MTSSGWSTESVESPTAKRTANASASTCHTRRRDASEEITCRPFAPRSSRCRCSGSRGAPYTAQTSTLSHAPRRARDFTRRTRHRAPARAHGRLPAVAQCPDAFAELPRGRRHRAHRPPGRPGACRGNAAAHALGRSRYAGLLHQQIRIRHAVRAAGRLRGTPADRLHQGRADRADRKRQQDALDRAPFFGGDPKGKSATRRSSATSTRSRRAAARLVRHRPARRPDSAGRCRRRRAPCRRPRAARQLRRRARSTGRKISRFGSAASRAGCRARCCPAATATPIRSCSRPASSRSATRWCTRRA